MPNQITSTPKKIVPKRQIKFTKQIRLLLSEDMFDKLKIISESKETNVNQVIRNFIAKGIKDNDSL